MDEETHEEEAERLYTLFEEADREWSIVLVKAFGKRRAGDVRYTPEGKGERVAQFGMERIYDKYSAELKAAYEKRNAACEAVYQHGRKGKNKQ